MATTRITLGLAILVALLGGCDPPAPPPAVEAPITGTVMAAAPAPALASAPAEGEAQPAPIERIDQAGLARLIAETAEQDRVLVIDFWATWCVPCVEIFEPLHRGVKDLGPGARMVSVTIDALETEAAAQRFLTRHDAMHDAFLLVPDTDQRLAAVASLGGRWSELSVPAVLVFGRDGKLAGEFLGSEAEVGPILSRVRALTDEQPQTRGQQP